MKSWLDQIDGRLWRDLGMLLLELKMFDDGVTAEEKALQINPAIVFA